MLRHGRTHAPPPSRLPGSRYCGTLLEPSLYVTSPSHACAAPKNSRHESNSGGCVCGKGRPIVICEVPPAPLMATCIAPVAASYRKDEVSRSPGAARTTSPHCALEAPLSVCQ